MVVRKFDYCMNIRTSEWYVFSSAQNWSVSAYTIASYTASIYITQMSEEWNKHLSMFVGDETCNLSKLKKRFHVSAGSN